MDALWAGSIEGWVEPAPNPPARPRRQPGRVPSARGEPTASDPTPPAPPADGGPPVPPAGAEAGPLTPLPVEVVRSAKRKKSVSARVVGGRIVVRMPQWMSKSQEAEYVSALVAKLERQRRSTAVDLSERAHTLARRYDLPEPRSIRWVGNQHRRWGSCTPATGEIRVSDRIAGFPEWVLDAVIVHELAHLVHAEHSPAFWALAHRYPKTERALGFLIAKDLTEGDDAA